VEAVNMEQVFIESNKKLIHIYEQKIKDRIAKVGRREEGVRCQADVN
jgi:hypothetical protein